jgi:hypothetical protein
LGVHFEKVRQRFTLFQQPVKFGLLGQSNQLHQRQTQNC